jgi:leucyl/phenylalanyl-tRNA--protein transferase
MFAKANNASKFALISLCKRLETQGVEVIDCQQETSHLKSLGAEMATKESFWKIIMDNQVHADQTINLKD